MIKVRLKKIKKRAVYETWFNKNRLTGLISYINKTPKTSFNDIEFFHFTVLCTKTRCKNEKCIGETCDKRVKYSSLNENLKYDTFDECVNALITWHEKWK